MTTKQFILLERGLLSEFPAFAIKGTLMFVPPVAYILRGLHFDGSSFDKSSFYVTVFVLPLCIPTKHLYFNFGNRIRHKGGGDRWNLEMPNLVSNLSAELKLQAIPFLDRVNSISDFTDLARSFSWANPHTPQAIAFSLAREGRFEQSIAVMDKLIPELDLRVHWQLEILNQIKILKSKMVANPSEAKQLLINWEIESALNLKLGGAEGVSCS